MPAKNKELRLPSLLARIAWGHRWYRWWPWLILRRWYRADLYRPDILIGFAGLLFAIIGLIWALPFFEGYTHRWQAWLIAIFILLGPLPLFSGWFILWTANPETYARISLAGRPIQEALYLLARDAHKACKAVLQRIQFEDFNLEQASIPTLESLENLASTVRKQLRRGNRKQEWLLRRIETMKYRVRDDFKIPIRRLCDHVLQYSPIIQRDRTRKQLKEWTTLDDSDEPKASNDEKEAASGRIWCFARNTLRRKHLLEEIMAFRDLHHYIYSFSATYSSSGSLQTYAQALHHVATQKSQWKWLNWDKDATQRRFVFLYRKQRAHPGFSLHEQLKKALKSFGDSTQESEDSTSPKASEKKPQDPKDSSGEPGTRPAERENSQDPDAASDEEIRSNALLALDHIINSAEKGTEDKGNNPAIGSQNQARMSDVQLQNLQKLPDFLNRQITKDRSRMVQNFADWFEDRYSDLQAGTMYIVSHGYSRNVLAVLLYLECCLPEYAGGENNRHWLSSGRARVFFHLSPEEDPFDTRLMEYEVREAVLITECSGRKKRKERERQVAQHWAAGDHHVLLNLLNPGDRVLVLLGAEAFDEDRRVVHPRGMDLERFVEDIRKMGGQDDLVGIEVAVVAEEYKSIDSLAAATHFYHQHFDRLTVYPRGKIKWIFTSKPRLRGRDGHLP